MDLETVPRDAQTGKFLFDRSEEWLRVGQHDEPDFSVDGLHKPSLLARLLGRLLKQQ